MEIPFQEQFKEALLSGKKTETSRNKKYGGIGWEFEAFGAKFAILDIRKVELRVVAEHHFDKEGFESPREFVDCWEKIHPIKGYFPDHKVWLHTFKRID